MLWFFYNILFVIGFLLLLPHFLWRMRRRGGYAKDFWQRLGRYSPEVKAKLGRDGAVWVHAVSVGELFIALRLMDEWRSRVPDTHFVLTVTTSTGHALAEKSLLPQDTLLYFPVDITPVMRRVCARIRPSAIVLMECELWPNLIRHAARLDVPVFLVNGRLSEHSFQGYRKLGLFTRRVLPLVRLFCAQSAGDAERLKELGAPAESVHVLGSAKYDVAATEERMDDGGALLRSVGLSEECLVLLGGSTWDGEEEVLLDVYRELYASNDRARLVLVPRHVERTPKIVNMLHDKGFTCRRRSEASFFGETGREPPVVLVDTTGELRQFYACADIVFVGKSLTQSGGQNILEPAQCGKPVLVGPHMENFPAVMEDFLASDAVIQVRDQAELRTRIAELANDPDSRASYGERAHRVVDEKKGALARTTDLLLAHLSTAGNPLPGERTGGEG